MKIGIIGGGIGGLTMSLALRKMGFEPKIFERAEKLNEVGAGIWMQPNAIKVFKWLGIDEEIIKAGKLLNKVEIVDKNLTPYAGEQISNEGTDKLVSIHRARLQSILYKHLPSTSVHLNSPFSKFNQTENGVEVNVNGDNENFDILIGADGINSMVRNQLFGTVDKRYSGQTCWRGISDITLPPELLGDGKEAWGKNIRFGFANISENEVYWFAVVNAPEGQVDTKSAKGNLLSLFKDFHPTIKSILDNTREDKIIRNDISDLKRLSTWSSGRVCLIGDAAHATTPNMGQGAGQSIEDAYFLSNLLHKNENPTLAFQQFENLRRKKVDYIVNNSWTMGGRWLIVTWVDLF